jgi:hypothetical protein
MSKRTFHLLLVSWLIASTVWAANDPFVGRWKLNPSKSKLVDYMKVKGLGANKYGLDLGGGAVETIVADGTDQRGLRGTTLSVTVEGPVNWKVVRKKGGHTLVTGIWTLSQGGKTLSDHFTANRPDGSTSSVDYLYKRTTPGSGFVGTWVSTSEPHSAFELQIRPYEGDGLSFINPAQRMTTNMKFDGKDYRPVGPNIPPGAASSGRRVNERTLEIADKMEGKVGETREMTLSPDLKTMMVTVHASGLSDPNTIVVFDRE